MVHTIIDIQNLDIVIFPYASTLYCYIATTCDVINAMCITAEVSWNWESEILNFLAFLQEVSLQMHLILSTCG